MNEQCPPGRAPGTACVSAHRTHIRAAVTLLLERLARLLSTGTSTVGYSSLLLGELRSEPWRLSHMWKCSSTRCRDGEEPPPSPSHSVRCWGKPSPFG